MGVPVAELATRFRENPLGLVTSDGEPFVRSPQQVKGTDAVFYCEVSEGMELHVLRARDIVEDTRRDLDAAIASLDGVSAVINFHCILRTLELEPASRRRSRDRSGHLRSALGDLEIDRATSEVPSAIPRSIEPPPRCPRRF